MNKIHAPAILIVEDDPDQMVFGLNMVTEQIRLLMNDANTNPKQFEELTRLKLIKAPDILTLKKSLQACKSIVFALIDCNIPDKAGQASHDQFVKDNHLITGQHRSVDLVLKHSSDLPITITSSKDRFKTTISRYYQNTHNLEINFVSKRDPGTLRRNIAYSLRKHLRNFR